MISSEFAFSPNFRHFHSGFFNAQIENEVDGKAPLVFLILSRPAH